METQELEYSMEIIERLREKIPLMKNIKHKIYGITQLDVYNREGNLIKQYLLAFERLQLIEPQKKLSVSNGDVYIQIKDENLYRIARQEISLDDAISQRKFKVYGDIPLWELQLKALRKVLLNEKFEEVIIEEPEPEPEPESEIIEDCPPENDKNIEDEKTEIQRESEIIVKQPELTFLANAMDILYNKHKEK